MNQGTPLADALQAIFGPVADQLAVELGVVRRHRTFSGSSLVQTLVFGWLHRPDASAWQLAEMAARCHAVVTPQALLKRFGPRLNRLLEALIARALGQLVAAPPRAAELLRRFPAVWVYDSTVIPLPDDLATTWSGCGGNAGVAALKVQVGWDVLGGALRGSLEAGRCADRAAKLPLDDLVPGSIRLTDLGYFDVGALAELSRRRAFFLTRIQVGTAVFDARGRRLDLWTILEGHPGVTFQCEMCLGVRERLSCRLVASRCPEAVVAQRLERLQAEAIRRGRVLSQRQRRSCGWTVLVTNVPATKLSGAEMTTLYRVRWQIELLFKLWKQGNRLSRPRQGPPERMLGEVYAKLLGGIVQHWILLSSGGERADRSSTKASRWVRESIPALARIVSGGLWRQLGRLTRDLRRELAWTARITPRRQRPSTWQTLGPLADPIPKVP